MRNLDQRGATAIEYALLIALIAVAGTTAFILAGSQSRATMTTVASSLDASKTLDLPAPAAPPAP